MLECLLLRLVYDGFLSGLLPCSFVLVLICVVWFAFVVAWIYGLLVAWLCGSLGCGCFFCEFCVWG